MKRTIKQLIGNSFFRSHLDRWLLPHAGVVVAFHRVRPIGGDDSLTISVPDFEEYCRFFARTFNVVPLSDLVASLRRGKPLNRELAITFDDGYEDNARHAAPVLERLGLPATFFVVSRWIGSDVVAWWDQDAKVPHPWMSWSDVQSLHNRGFEIGGHTLTHVDLGQVPNALVREEVLGARLDLEERLGAPVRSFAYPYGRRANITEAARQIVRESGFQCCCSAFGGVNTAGTDPFHILRIPITPECISPHVFGFDVALGRTQAAA